MKKQILAVLSLFFLLPSLSFAITPKSQEDGDKPTEFIIDPEHSSITFKVKHLGIGDVVGQFRGFGGIINFHPSNLTMNRVEATIQSKSIDTANPKRDKHLASPDFLDVAKFRDIRFVSTEVIGDVKGSFIVKGLFSLHGMSLPIELNVTYLGEQTDPWGFERISFKGTTSINRKDFGIAWDKTLGDGTPVVGDIVLIELNIQGAKQKPPPI